MATHRVGPGPIPSLPCLWLGGHNQPNQAQARGLTSRLIGLGLVQSPVCPACGSVTTTNPIKHKLGGLTPRLIGFGLAQSPAYPAVGSVVATNPIKHKQRA